MLFRVESKALDNLQSELQKPLFLKEKQAEHHDQYAENDDGGIAILAR